MGATTTVFEPSPSCQAPGFLCKDGLTCVGPAQVCDGISDCPQHEEGEGGEDEEGCAGSGGGQPDELATTDASVTEDEDDSSVTTENAVTTTEQSDVSDDKKDFPEVKLEREDNEVEIDAESEKETSVEEGEEFGAEQPRSFS